VLEAPGQRRIGIARHARVCGVRLQAEEGTDEAVGEPGLRGVNRPEQAQGTLNPSHVFVPARQHLGREQGLALDRLDDAVHAREEVRRQRQKEGGRLVGIDVDARQELDVHVEDDRAQGDGQRLEGRRQLDGGAERDGAVGGALREARRLLIAALKNELGSAGVEAKALARL